MSVIDTHQHFWWIARRPHEWPPAVGDRLDRDYTPDDLKPQLDRAGVDGTILIQSLNDADETVIVGYPERDQGATHRLAVR